MTAPPRPILRWHGGKWLTAPWIISHFGKHKVYVEPFGGAMSTLLRKPRSHAEVYNDLDGMLVGFFRVLQDSIQSERLLELLRATPFARAEFELAYQISDDPVEEARRLIVRSFMGFGSPGALRQTTGFRANSNRSGTTPGVEWSNFHRNVQAVAERIRPTDGTRGGVVLECRPAVAVMAAHDGPDTLHYVDPPYLTALRSPGNTHCAKHRYAHELSDDDHLELLTFLRTLAGTVILSGYPSLLYEEGLVGWHRFERAALADGARKRTEVLWLNPHAAARLPHPDLLSAA